MTEAWRIEGGFGLDRLTRVTLDDAPGFAPKELGPHDVTVRVRAVSLNYRDLMMVRGEYDPRQALPLVPCSDLAGEVIRVGRDVTRVKVGDRVISQFAQAWIDGEPTQAKLRSTLGGPLEGTLATERTLDEQGLVMTPAHLTDIEAATLPCAAVTAWRALVDHGGLRAGESVLVLGSGGVSTFALQFAKGLGARVIATTRSEGKAAMLRQLGADDVLVGLGDRLGKEVRARTENRGVDHVVEVGGAGTLAQSIASVRVGGAIHVIGVLAGASEPFAITPVLMRELRLLGAMVGPRSSSEAMCRWIGENGLRPIVDRVFGLDEVPAAFAHLASGAHVGKVVVAMPS